VGPSSTALDKPSAARTVVQTFGSFSSGLIFAVPFAVVLSVYLHAPKPVTGPDQSILPPVALCCALLQLAIVIAFLRALALVPLF
jgi:hypothetical protein